MIIRFDVLRQQCLWIVAAVLMAIPLGLPSQSHAASPEQRCTELGANCICSEPLNTATYVNTPYSWAWNPADSTTKECAISGAAGAAIERNEGDFSGSNSAAILNALPQGHAVSRVFKGADSHTGIFNLGNEFPSTAPTARRAFRYYVYLSPDFVFSIEGGGCLNSGKMLHFTLNGPVLSYNGNWNLYSWTAWSNQGYDCCNLGPGQDSGFGALSTNSFKGKWHRIEGVMKNVGGVPTVLQVYWKNVTDNGPEYKVVDTSITQAQIGSDAGWPISLATTLTHAKFGDSGIEWFRNGSCPGFFAASHIVYAAWSTDAGQRIGAAYEIEGGTGSAPPPSNVPPAAPGTPTIR